MENRPQIRIGYDLILEYKFRQIFAQKDRFICGDKKKCFAHFQDCIENGERWETLRNIAQKDHLLASYIKKSLLYCLESIKKVLAPSPLLSIAKTLVPCSP